jgi:membrane protein YqaA with SNARE-associated domain
MPDSRPLGYCFNRALWYMVERFIGPRRAGREADPGARPNQRENPNVPDDELKHPPGPFPGNEEEEAIREEQAGLEALEREEPAPVRHRIRTVILILEVAFVAGLVVLWLTSKAIHHSNSLWVLFLYSVPSQFLVAVLPHEPVILYFGKFYPPLAVALISATGAVLTEFINYSVFKYVADFKAFEKVIHSRLIVKSVTWFKKAPFLVLWVAGLTPVPFYPFRFMVVVARYPLPAYALAVLTSRLPRFYILALLGNKFAIPNWVIIGLFLVLMLAAVLPLTREFLRKEKNPPGPSAP